MFHKVDSVKRKGTFLLGRKSSGVVGACPLYPRQRPRKRISANVMTALPPKADMCSALAYVCFGPQADIARSFLRAGRP